VPKTATAYAITIGSVGLAALLFMLPSVSDWHRKSPSL
jgi:hypothetical protein